MGGLKWAEGIQYNPGDVVKFQGRAYKILQGHKSQGDWTPERVPALWQVMGGEDSEEEGHGKKKKKKSGSREREDSGGSADEKGKGKSKKSKKAGSEEESGGEKSKSKKEKKSKDRGSEDEGEKSKKGKDKEPKHKKSKSQDDGDGDYEKKKKDKKKDKGGASEDEEDDGESKKKKEIEEDEDGEKKVKKDKDSKEKKDKGLKDKTEKYKDAVEHGVEHASGGLVSGSSVGNSAAAVAGLYASSQAWIDAARERTAAFQQGGPKSPTTWVLAEANQIAKDAIVAGEDKAGIPLYVARAYYEGSLQIGRASKNGGFIGYSGREIPVSQYEVLLGDSKAIRWVPSTSGSSGVRPVEGGIEKDGKPLLIVQTRYGGEILPGKAKDWISGALVALGGQEISSKEYNVLAYV